MQQVTILVAVHSNKVDNSREKFCVSRIARFVKFLRN